MADASSLDRTLLRGFPLPHHAEDGDKEDRGLALIVAGSRELVGAAMLAGTGALRAGAGKLRIATAASVAPALAVAVPEARVIGFAEAEDGCIAADAARALADRCAGADSLTLGPGMRGGEGLRRLIEALLESGESHPLVLDAAALPLLPDLAAMLRAWCGGAVLLPHAGEMARMLDRGKEEVRRRPLAAALEAADRFNAVVVLKGECSHVVAPDGRSFGYGGGGIGLATSGSGDALAGIVGGLAARGADPLTAALWGVFLHGEAGAALARDIGRVGFLAREIPDRVPRLMDEFCAAG